jgi:hypothetical protein
MDAYGGEEVRLNIFFTSEYTASINRVGNYAKQVSEGK